MRMWSSTTCTCGTVKHVHVKQYCLPGKGMFLSEKDKVQYRVRITILLRGHFRHQKDTPDNLHY